LSGTEATSAPIVFGSDDGPQPISFSASTLAIIESPYSNKKGNATNAVIGTSQ